MVLEKKGPLVGQEKWKRNFLGPVDPKLQECGSGPTEVHWNKGQILNTSKRLARTVAAVPIFFVNSQSEKPMTLDQNMMGGGNWAIIATKAWCEFGLTVASGQS